MPNHNAACVLCHMSSSQFYIDLITLIVPFVCRHDGIIVQQYSGHQYWSGIIRAILEKNDVETLIDQPLNCLTDLLPEWDTWCIQECHNVDELHM